MGETISNHRMSRRPLVRTGAAARAGRGSEKTMDLARDERRGARRLASFSTKIGLECVPAFLRASCRSILRDRRTAAGVLHACEAWCSQWLAAAEEILETIHRTPQLTMQRHAVGSTRACVERSQSTPFVSHGDADAIWPIRCKVELAHGTHWPFDKIDGRYLLSHLWPFPKRVHER